MNKKCFKCEDEKPLTEFYKHNAMKDGRLNKCIDCTKKDVKNRESRLKEDPEYIQKERKRQREKYYRLNYKDKHKPTTEQKKATQKRYQDKYPEKYLTRNRSRHMKPQIKGNHLHHWSYKFKHAKDVIELTPKDHSKAHRYLIYDQSEMMYRTISGNLLDTKEKHKKYILQCIEIDF